jgi:chromate transporter
MNQLELFTQSVLLGLQAIGGVMSTIPAIERMELMPAETLTHLVAIGQASPGPNMLLIPLFGWQLAGVLGALTATLGFCLPSASLVLIVFSRWSSFKRSAWKVSLQGFFSAIGAAAVILSTFSFARIIQPSFWGAVLILVVAYCSLKSKVFPVVLIVGGGLIGLLGIF